MHVRKQTGALAQRVVNFEVRLVSLVLACQALESDDLIFGAFIELLDLYDFFGLVRLIELVEYSRLSNLLVHVLVSLDDALTKLILLLLLDLRRVEVLLNRVLVGSLVIHRILGVDLDLLILLELVRVCALILAVDEAQQQCVVGLLFHELRVVVIQVRVH